MERIPILLINYYYPPIVNGGVQRTYNFKKFLSHMGFEVTFLTTSSYGRYDNDEENTVIRFPDWGYDYTHADNSSRLGAFLFRAFRLAQVKLGLILDGKYYWKREVMKGLDKVMQRKQYRIVIASYPDVANLEIGEAINKRYGIPLIVDYRDGLMFEMFNARSCFFVRKMRLGALERKLAEIASLHITVNDEMNEYYASHYPNVKSVMIPNGFDDEEIINCPPLDLPEGINVLYTGAITKSRRVYSDTELENILSFLFEVSPSVNFVFVGDYTKAEKAVFHKYRNVYIYDKTDRATVIATQRTANALLLFSGPRGFTSGKLYEYLFAGKPILNIGGPAGVAKLIDGRYYGLTCSPNEHEKIREFIVALENGHLTFERGDLQQYARRYQSKLLAHELNRIIGLDYIEH